MPPNWFCIMLAVEVSKRRIDLSDAVGINQIVIAVLVNVEHNLNDCGRCRSTRNRHSLLLHVRPLPFALADDTRSLVSYPPAAYLCTLMRPLPSSSSNTPVSMLSDGPNTAHFCDSNSPVVGTRMNLFTPTDNDPLTFYKIGTNQSRAFKR